MNRIVNSTADEIAQLDNCNQPMLYENYVNSLGINKDGVDEKENANNNWTEKLVRQGHSIVTVNGKVISDHKCVQGRDLIMSMFSWNVIKNTQYFYIRDNQKSTLRTNSGVLMNNVSRIEMLDSIINSNKNDSTVIGINECDLSLHKLMETSLSDYRGHFIPKRIFKNGEHLWIQEDGMSIFVKKDLAYTLTLYTWSSPAEHNLAGLTTRNVLIRFQNEDVIVTHSRQKNKDTYKFICKNFAQDTSRPLYAIGDFNHNIDQVKTELNSSNIHFDMIDTRGLDHIIKIKKLKPDKPVNCSVYDEEYIPPTDDKWSRAFGTPSTSSKYVAKKGSDSASSSGKYVAKKGSDSASALPTSSSGKYVAKRPTGSTFGTSNTNGISGTSSQLYKKMYDVEITEKYYNGRSNVCKAKVIAVRNSSIFKRSYEYEPVYNVGSTINDIPCNYYLAELNANVRLSDYDDRRKSWRISAV